MNRRAIAGLCVAAVGQIACGATNIAQSDLPGAMPHSGAQPEAANRLLHRGLGFLQRGDTLRAEQYLTQALKGGADPGVAVPPLIRACMEGNRLEAAALHAEDYLDIVPGQNQLQLFLAGLYVTLRRTPQALDHLQRLLARDPDNGTGHLLLARLLRDELQDYSGAYRHFRRYLDLQPNGPDAAEARASALSNVRVEPSDRE